MMSESESVSFLIVCSFKYIDICMSFWVVWGSGIGLAILSDGF